MQDNNTKSTRGLHFEKRVMNRLQSHFDPDLVIHDLNIPGRKDKDAQIDFVLLDRTGIYIIEAKGYSGVATGSYSNAKWTKTITARDGRIWTNKQLNPLVQNRKHIKAMKNLLNDETIPIISVAVVSDKCDLSKITGRHRGEYIFGLKEFATKLEELIWYKRKVLSESRVEEIRAAILAG